VVGGGGLGWVGGAVGLGGWGVFSWGGVLGESLFFSRPPTRPTPNAAQANSVQQLVSSSPPVLRSFHLSGDR